MECITGSDYKRGKRTWENSEIKKLGVYQYL